MLGSGEEEYFEDPSEEWYRPSNRISPYLPQMGNSDDHPIALAEAYLVNVESSVEREEIVETLKMTAIEIRRIVANASGIEFDERQTVEGALDFLPDEIQQSVLYLRGMMSGLHKDYILASERMEISEAIIDRLENGPWKKASETSPNNSLN